MAQYGISPVRKRPEESGMGWLGILGAAIGATVAIVGTAGAATPAVAAAAPAIGTGAATGAAAGMGAGIGAATVGGGAAAGALAGSTAATAGSAFSAAGAGAGAAAGAGASEAAKNAIGKSVSDGMGSWESLRGGLTSGKDAVGTAGNAATEAANAADKLSTWDSMKRLYSGAKNFVEPIQEGRQLGGMADSIIKKSPKAQSETTAVPTGNAGSTAEQYGQPSEHLQKALAALKTQSPAMQEAYGPSLQEAFNRATKRQKGMA